MSDVSTRKAVLHIRSQAGYWREETPGVVLVSGADAGSWLHSQTCNDVLSLPSGRGHLNAVLDRKGRLIAVFHLFREGDRFLLLTDIERVEPLLNHLDMHLFSEDAAVEDQSGRWASVALEGPRSLPHLAWLGIDPLSLPPGPMGCARVEVGGVSAWVLRMSISGEMGYHFLVEPGQEEPLTRWLTGKPQSDSARSMLHHDLSQLMTGLATDLLPVQLIEARPHVRETLRIEAGWPLWGVDINETTRISETPLEAHAISYTKGCYTGQEVVAKIKAGKGPKKAIWGLRLPDDAPVPPIGTPCLLGGHPVGETRSGCWSPVISAPVVMAWLDRTARIAGTNVQIEGVDGLRNAEVVTLPFHNAPSRLELARKRYQEGLDRFDRDPNDIDPEVIMLLREAVLLDPLFEDAYESLGVILHRQGRTEEAVDVMLELKRLNPDSVMAHTNLSVFFVHLGRIEEAEKAKAQAALLQFRQDEAARKAARSDEEERTRKLRETEERLGLFIEVLDMDPDDLLANYGAGSSLLALGRPGEALPLLEKSVVLQPDYSAAWLQLGQALETLGRADDAAEAYRSGVMAASARGDLQPLQAMQQRLAAINTPA